MWPRGHRGEAEQRHPRIVAVTSGAAACAAASSCAQFDLPESFAHRLDAPELLSFANFHQLAPDRQWIPVPSVFLCFFSALIPPLWHNLIIMPALKRWDNEFATPEERELARAQNRAAGWPDWFDERPPGRLATA